MNPIDKLLYQRQEILAKRQKFLNEQMQRIQQIKNRQFLLWGSLLGVLLLILLHLVKISGRFC